jgi:hypothetical protein
MSVDQQIVVDGHVVRELLRDFALRPVGFDDDTVEEIWQHLDECQDCMANYEAIRDGQGPKSRKPAGEPSDEPVRSVPSDDYRNDDRPKSVLEGLESSIDAIRDGQSDTYTQLDTENVDEIDDGLGSVRPRLFEVHEIDGLISGTVVKTDEEGDRLETETAVEASERLKRERTHHTESPEISGECPEGPESDGDKPAPDLHLPGAGHDRTEDVEDPLLDSVVEEEPPAKPAHHDTAARPVAPATNKKSEPLEDLVNNALAFLARPRNAIIVGSAALVLSAAIIAAVVFSGGEQERLNAGWEPLDVITTRAPLQEVMIRQIRRGSIPAASGPDVTLDFRGVDRLVIAVDLDFIREKSSPHELIVRNPDGLNVFQEPIPQVYLDDGRFFLRLVPKQFDTGEMYKLELITHRADQSSYVIAESVFDIIK